MLAPSLSARASTSPGKDATMTTTTMTTLNDVRANLIAQGYPADEVDATLTWEIR